MADKEKALAKTNLETVQRIVQAVAEPKVGVELLPGQRAFAFPEIRLHQGLSSDVPMDSKPGLLYSTDGNSIGKEIEVIPLCLYHSRVKFPPKSQGGDDAGGNMPVCMSDDGILSTKGIECKTCPDYDYERGKIDRCTKIISMICVPADTDKYPGVYVIRFKGKSYRAGAKLMTACQMITVTRPWSKSYMLATDSESNNMGKYWVFTIQSTGKTVEPQVQGELGKLYEIIAKAREKQLRETAEAAKNIKTIVDSADVGDVNPDEVSKSEPDFSKDL